MDLQDVIKKYGLHQARREDWDAPFIQNPRALSEYIEAVGIIGATIQKISIAGYGVCALDRLHVSSLYPEHIMEGRKNGHDVYREWDYVDTMAWLRDLSIKTRLLLYEPVIFETDKGIFSIDFSESSTIYVARNSLPEDAGKKPAYDRFDISKLLASATGAKVIGYGIEEEDFFAADDDFTNSFSVGLDENQDSYIKSFRLGMSNGQFLKFYNDYDDGLLELLDENYQPVVIPGSELDQYMVSPIGTPSPYDDRSAYKKTTI